jgi:hypothetical protein
MIHGVDQKTVALAWRARRQVRATIDATSTDHSGIRLLTFT